MAAREDMLAAGWQVRAAGGHTRAPMSATMVAREVRVEEFLHDYRSTSSQLSPPLASTSWSDASALLTRYLHCVEGISMA